MLHLAAADATFLSKSIATPGGFAWWYIDLVDENGNGLVIIWFFGLPFLPDSGSHPGHEKPGISIALYEEFRSTFYLLQEYDTQDATRDATSQNWTLGQTQLSADLQQGSVSITLDEPIPGTTDRLTGSIHISGTPCFVSDPKPGQESATHFWQPLMTACLGRARLRIGSREISCIEGRAYHDANCSPLPLWEQGIARWRWGRVALPGRERIHYIVEPKDPNVPPITWSVTVLSDGELTLDQDLAISWEGGRRNRYGLGWHEHAKLDSEIHGHLDLTYESVVDEGPFYLRFLISGIDPETGEHGCGVAETVVPDRIRIPWMNPLIRMRRHRVGGSNSIWVPLFCGSRRDRIARLLRHWGSKQRKAP